MKQQNKEKIEEALKVLEELKELRGGDVAPFHRKMANDPKLIKAFTDEYKVCKKGIDHIPEKYVEFILMALGCAKGVETTIKAHGALAIEKGATVEELGELLRIILLYCGTSAVIPAVEIFEDLE